MRKKTALFLAAAAVCTMLTAGIPTAYGAVGIDLKREGKITFTLDQGALRPGELADETYTGYYEELSNAFSEGTSLNVRIYQVAEVDAGGQYTLLRDYRGKGLDGLETADSQTAAASWSEWALAAEAVSEAETGPEAADEIQIQKGADGVVAGVSEGLLPGMYLACFASVDSPEYTYSFAPYLIPLPNNYYRGGMGEDEWIYGDEEGKPLAVGLKPERKDRYGNLVIDKTLTSWHETLQGASFVFEIKAEKEDQVVYNDVVSLNFDQAGTMSRTIEGIPAGAKVTVTEIYSGGSYEQTGAGMPEGDIIRADGEIHAAFTNQYDGRLNQGGISVVNHFTYEKDTNGNDVLNWEKQ